MRAASVCIVPTLQEVLSLLQRMTGGCKWTARDQEVDDSIGVAATYALISDDVGVNKVGGRAKKCNTSGLALSACAAAGCRYRKYLHASGSYLS